MIRFVVSLLATATLLGCAPTPWVSVADPAHIEAWATTGRFRLGAPRAIRITDGGALFLRTDPKNKQGDLLEMDLATGKERVLLTAQQILKGAEETLSAEEKALRERKRQVARGIASYQVGSGGKRLLVPLSGSLYVVERKTGTVTTIKPKGAGSPFDARFSPDATQIAFVRQGDVYVADIAAATIRRITRRAGDHETWGMAEFVAQEEMSRYHGYWWSPDGKQLLIQRTDNTDVERLWIADSKRPERAPSSAPYPRAGTRNAHVELHLFDLAAPEGTSARAVDWDRGRYPYLASVRWKYTKAPTLVVQNRRQTESVILSWAPDTGTISTLHTEADNAWVNLDQSVPRWLPDGKHFLWSTERNGDWQLEKRAADGSLVNTVTDVDLGYRELVHIDAKAGTAVIRMQPNPLEMHLARVPLAGGKAEQITTAVGGHSATFGDRGVWAHTHVAEDGTSTVRLKSATGEAKGTLTSLAPRPPRIPVVEYTTVKTADRELQAALIRPSNYEDGRKYPVVVYVYGGPHYQVVTRNRMRYWVQQWIADHGFVVVMLDGRGTPGKGRMWERSIKNDVITGPLKDQVDGLQALGVRYPELDMERVGLYGWSFGGYFSAMAVLRRPDVYKAGFSGAPVTDWRDYDTHYTERYMGLPAENKAGYDSTSAVVNAGKLTVPLTIAHGTVDDNVYFIHALKLSNALFEARRDHVFLPLSGYTHMVRGKKATLALFDRIAGWFVQHLGQPE